MIVLSKSEKAEIAKTIWRKFQSQQSTIAITKRRARDLDAVRRCYVKKFIQRHEGRKPDQASVEKALNAYFASI
ncbi:MAG: hypothetical protein AB4042_09805 [Leptolyngbyaceae cyanobacterium]